jgi:hypothetical protein
MANEASTQPRGMRTTPPRLTGADIRAKGALRVGLTTADLEQLARLLRAGKVLLNDHRSVSRNLRQAMARLGVDTSGL